MEKHAMNYRENLSSALTCTEREHKTKESNKTSTGDKKTMNNTNIMSIEEASSYLGLKKSTIYSWIFQRRIPFIKLGKLVKFDRRDIDKWLEGNKIGVCNSQDGIVTNR